MIIGESVVSGLEQKHQDYTIKYFPHKGDWASVAFVKVFFKGKQVGKMGLSGISKKQQREFIEDDKRNGIKPDPTYNYGLINWSELNSMHRGKGLYPIMLKIALKGVKNQGSDGVSTMAQSGDSKRIWSKIANKKYYPPMPGSGNATWVLTEPPKLK